MGLLPFAVAQLAIVTMETPVEVFLTILSKLHSLFKILLNLIFKISFFYSQLPRHFVCL